MRVIFLLFIFFISASHAADLYPFHSVKQQKEFQTLIHELRCVVCQNEDLASSDAPIANDLRLHIYKMVTENYTSRYIKQYMTDRYGDFVLLKPPFIQATFFLWIFPFVMLAAGAWVYCRATRRPRKGSNNERGIYNKIPFSFLK